VRFRPATLLIDSQDVERTRGAPRIVEVNRTGDTYPAIVLKIETRRGFENLPAMLLEAMKSPRPG
jgi:hypothetical protein